MCTSQLAKAGLIDKKKIRTDKISLNYFFHSFRKLFQEQTYLSIQMSFFLLKEQFLFSGIVKNISNTTNDCGIKKIHYSF